MKFLTVALVLIGLAAVAKVPRVAAQAPVYPLGVLTPGLGYGRVFDGLREGLAKAGLVEGRDIKFIVEDTEGDAQSFSVGAEKLVRARPALIFSFATAPSLAVRKATQTIPIVFAVVGDPVLAGLVESFASSRNNVTGVSSFSAPLSGKRLEILKDIAPGVKNVLVVVAVKEVNAQAALPYMIDAAQRLRVHLLRRDVVDFEQVKDVLAERWAGKVDAVLHVPSVLMTAHAKTFIAKAKKERLPLIAYDDASVESGALASYSGDFRLFGIQAAKLAAKILKGAKPADLPIETPEHLILKINLGTAKAIGLRIPPAVLERAEKLVD